jgi:adenylate cyclase
LAPLQEVAYRSELSERRARIHEAVARALEQQHPDERDQLAALISHHLEQAGQGDLAARWSTRAAALGEVPQAGGAPRRR